LRRPLVDSYKTWLSSEEFKYPEELILPDPRVIPAFVMRLLTESRFFIFSDTFAWIWLSSKNWGNSLGSVPLDTCVFYTCLVLDSLFMGTNEVVMLPPSDSKGGSKNDNPFV